MKKYVFLAAFLLSSTFSTAHADPKFLGIEWYDEHWDHQEFIPYYDNGTEPQSTQWDNSTWQPINWIKDSGVSGEQFIAQLRNVDILGDTGRENGAPYINVGPNFYHLSGYDKGRVVATLDAVYQVTSKKTGMFYLRDPRTKKLIGTYTKSGLVLE